MKRLSWAIGIVGLLAWMAPAMAQDAAPAAPPPTAPVAAPPPAPPPSAAAAAATRARAERVERINKAVAILIAEANDLDNFEKEDVQVHFRRPHPVLSTWGSDMSIDVLQRMLQPFTGNEYRDTYIRWHLMSVVNRASQADRMQTGPLLVQLIKQMPGPLRGLERPDHRYEPPEIAAKYFALANSAQVVVGYPPFQRVVGAPESFKYMKPDQVAKIKANLEEAAQLRPLFKVIVDRAAQQWNARVRQMNWIIRQYRGELIYALLLTGDPEMAKLVMSEVDRQARAKNGIAFDLLAYVYLAAFDGAMDIYDGKTLLEMSRMLEASARAMEGYTNYGGRPRNFADYSFHLIYMLQEGGGFITAMDANPQP